ncbi:hypothetical protein CEUSTIGMA_g321.t1 [Chlamydomonas eustigma]|uniref:EamA domain-containing protein n=1 Tax=Chlamydomonas eustigma TaxID=1157962 RepID=A0A250WQ84_9CHLO|nr:hypothetical protein CEUSTIGMA_g321.t1 [Chlamydomonas eustigma]|eukprot:GAX72866.1 hypothetical protein CEUSTIGMA_g321.t1 [Chlamydomonas eustigma]
MFFNSLHVYAWLVGILWGTTNSLVKRGALVAEAKTLSRRGSSGKLDAIIDHVTTPAFVVPQLLNQVGSGLFIYLLGISDITVVVPAANAISVLCNALADVLLGESYNIFYLLSGLVLLFGGVILCGL